MAFYLTTIYLNKRMITNYYLKKVRVFWGISLKY